MIEKGSWSVVSTIRAPQFMVDKFIDHYLRLGATEIHIFFDDPTHINYEKNIKNIKKIKTYICDDNFWKFQPKPFPIIKVARPENIEHRQYANCNYAQNVCQSEWLLHVDVDELLYSQEKISDVLKTFPDQIFLVLVKPLEAVYNYTPQQKQVFETNYFKSAKQDFSHIVKSLYDKDIQVGKTGFWGHITGKSFFKVAETIKFPACHLPLPLNSNLIARFTTQRMELLHFEGMSIDLFVEKRLRRISKESFAKHLTTSTQARLDLFQHIFEKKGVEGIEELYRKMHVFNEEQLKTGLQSNFICIRNFNNIKPFSNQIHEIKTFHGDILIYNTETEIVEGISVENFEQKTHRKIQINIEPGNSGLAFFYFVEKNNIYYLFPDMKNRLRQYNRNQAHILNFKKVAENQYNIMFNDNFLCATAKGLVTLDRKVAKEWECFHISL